MSIHDLKKMLLTEGILYGAYGVFYGLLVGSGLYYLIYKEMMNTSVVRWSLFIKEIAVATIGVIVIIFISMIFPLKRIQKMNIIENMRGDE